MKQKHYPIEVAGCKAAASLGYEFNWAVLTIKIPHRVGESISVKFRENCIYTYTDHRNYIAIKIDIWSKRYHSATEAAQKEAENILEVIKYVNFDAADEFITKELYNRL